LDNKYGKVTNAIEKIIGTIPTGFIGIGKEEDSSTFHLLVYIIGISFIDFRIKIESNIKTSTKTSINTMTHKILVEPETSAYIFCTIQETIDANISNETQFQIHFSVINSPNHIKRTDHIVITKAVIITFGKAVLITLPHKR
jgi:hypothetical protein